MGTGNRERPLLTVTSDRFYTLLDYDTAKGAPGAAPIRESALDPTRRRTYWFTNKAR